MVTTMGQDAAKITVVMTHTLITTMRCRIRTTLICLWMPSQGSKRASSQMRAGHDQAQPLDLGQGQPAQHGPRPLAPAMTAATAGGSQPVMSISMVTTTTVVLGTTMAMATMVTVRMSISQGD